MIVLWQSFILKKEIIMESYLIEIIVNSKEDKCKKINSLIRKGIISPDEIIKIVIFTKYIRKYFI